MKKIISTFTSILIFVCGFGIATAEQLILTPVVQGSAVDQGPQDGVFDAFLAPPNDRQLNNNGGDDARFAFEFDMSAVPIGAEILSAELQVCISISEGPRDVELHEYDANGMLELDDYARNGFIENKILQPPGFLILFFDVTNNIARITGNAIGFAGYNLRDIFTEGRPNFTVMAVEEQCILIPDSQQVVDFPRLVINISDNPHPPAEAGNQFVRVIKLFPTTGGRYDKARGQFRIFQIGAAGFSNAIYSVQGLPDQQRSRAYAVYATTPSLGRLRVQMFNSVPSFQTITSFTTLPFLFNPAWLEDDVTIEVYIEEDDGFDAPNVGGLLVLSGFSAGTP